MNPSYNLTITFKGAVNYNFEKVKHDLPYTSFLGETLYTGYPNSNDIKVKDGKLYIKNNHIPIRHYKSFLRIIDNMRRSRNKYLKAEFLIDSYGECMYRTQQFDKYIQIVMTVLADVSREYKQLTESSSF